MYSRRLVQILFLALSILIATRASWFQAHQKVEARQVASSSPADTDADPTSTPEETSVAVTSSDAPTSTSEPVDMPSSTSSSEEPTSTTEEPTTSDTPTPTPTPTTTPDAEPSSTSSVNTGPITTPPTADPTSTPAPTASDDDSDSNTESSSDADTSMESEASGDSTRSTRATTLPPVRVTSTVVFTTTDERGSTTVQSSEAVILSTPALTGNGSSGSGNGGLTPKERSIVIGVTVGVGGAIILAAAGILYWRLRNKRRSQEENEELISYGAGFGGPGTAEKPDGSGPSAGARSPFQSTLETYHAPTQTNAASNF